MGQITSEHSAWKRLGRIGLSAVVAGTAILFALSSAPSADASTVASSATVTVKASVVSFVSAGAKTTTAKVAIGQPFGAKLPVPTRTGYTFQGWWAPNGVQVFSTTPMPACKTMTLTAKWAAISVKVTLNPKGGKVSPKSVVLTFDKAYTLPTPKKPGYTFTGWFTKDGKLFAQSGTSALTQATTLCAGWQKVPPKKPVKPAPKHQPQKGHAKNWKH